MLERGAPLAFVAGIVLNVFPGVFPLIALKDIAELDVNWSYPKFLVYQPASDGTLEASSLFPGFVFTKDEYVRRKSPKDFFYLERR